MVRASIRPSRLLTALVLLSHVTAGALVILLQVGIEWKTAMAAAIVASLAGSLWRYAFLRAGGSIVEVRVDHREGGAVRMRTGGWRGADILGTSCVTPILTAINLRVEGSRTPRHVLLVRDNVDAEDFRRIRVLLRWARPKPNGGAASVEQRPADRSDR
jgi:toxin CptA